jgi:hypothetical protein
MKTVNFKLENIVWEFIMSANYDVGIIFRLPYMIIQDYIIDENDET